MPLTLTRSSWWRALRLAAAAVACLLAVLATAGPAAAHAYLVSTDPADGAVLPASPGSATFTFSEPLRLPPDGVQVFDAEGGVVEASATNRDAVVTVDLPDELADGSYVVAWRVVSADGHPIVGSLTFSVGRPSEEVAAPEVGDADDPAVTTALSVVHALTYLGLALVVGLAVFLALSLPASAPAERPRRRINNIVDLAAVLAGVAAVVGLPLTVVDQQGLGLSASFSPSTWADAPGSTIASVAVLLLGLALVSAMVTAVLPRHRALLALGVGLVVVSPSVVGHSRTFGPESLVVATDVLHVLAGSIWLGGLVGLAITLPTLAGLTGHAAATVARFSALAAGVLAALVATGSLLAWRIVGSWTALVDTDYGRLLLVKVGLVGLATAIAGWNRFVLVPRVEGDGGFQQRRAGAMRIGRVVAVEAVAIVAALGLTGFLVNQDPGAAAPVLAARGTGVESVPLGTDHTVLADVEPARVGPNTVRVRLQDVAGEPFEPSRPPLVTLRSESIDLGEVRLTSDAPGTYLADVVLPRAGRWELQVSVRLSRFDNPVATLELDVS